MAPVETHSALVHRGPFDAESRKYAVFEFLETFIAWFDNREHDASGMKDFYTADFLVHTPHADHVESNADEHGYGDNHAATRVVSKLYMDPLKDHKQFPQTFYAIEMSDGYEVFAKNIMYVDVAGDPVAGETKVKDPDGREWDVEIPVFYDSELVKDETAKHNGLKFRSIKVIKDTGVVNHILDARGMGHKRSIN